MLTVSRTMDGYNESVSLVGSHTNIGLNDHSVLADGTVYSGGCEDGFDRKLIGRDQLGERTRDVDDDAAGRLRREA